eukprot:SM000174S03331  [mRNA]  locus=s174:73339:79015:+ [translate_table: standard]
MALAHSLQAGDLVALSTTGGEFFVARRSGSGKSAAWDFYPDVPESAITNKVWPEALLMVLKTGDGNCIGFRSPYAEGKVLQAAKDRGLVLRFNNHNFESWEQWLLQGESLSDVIIVNKQFPDKQFKAMIHRLSPQRSAAHRAAEELDARTQQERGVESVPANGNADLFHASDFTEQTEQQVQATVDLQAKVEELQSFQAAAKEKLLEMEGQVARSAAQVASLTSEVSSSARIIVKLARSKEQAELAAKAAQEQLATANSDLSTSAGLIKELERKLAERQREDVQGSADELQSVQMAAREKLLEMEGQVTRSAEEVARLTSEVSKSAEVNANLAKLKEQAEVAAETAQSRLAEVNSEVRDSANLAKELETKLAEGQREAAAVAEETKAKLADLVQRAERAEERAASLAGGVNSTIRSLEDRVSAANTENRDLRELLATSEAAQRDAAQRLRQLEGELAAMEQAKAEIEQQKREIQSSGKEADAKVAAAKMRVFELEHQLAAAGEETTSLAASRDSVLAQASALKEELADARSQAKDAASGSKETVARLAAAEAALTGLHAELALAKERESHAVSPRALEEAEARAQKLLEQVAALDHLLRAAENRLEAEKAAAADKVLKLTASEMMCAELEKKMTSAERRREEEGSKAREEIGNMQSWVGELQAMLQRAESENITTGRRAADIETHAQQLQTQLAALVQENASLINQASALQGRLQEIMTEREKEANEAKPKSFREVSLEGEIAQLKSRIGDNLVWRQRVSDMESRLRDAEAREQHKADLLAAEEEKMRAAQEEMGNIRNQLIHASHGEGELEAAILDVTQRVQVAEAEAAASEQNASALQSEVDQLHVQVSTLRDKLSSMELEKEQLRKESKNARRKEQEKDKVLRDLRAEMAVTQARIAESEVVPPPQPEKNVRLGSNKGAFKRKGGGNRSKAGKADDGLIDDDLLAIGHARPQKPYNLAFAYAISHLVTAVLSIYLGVSLRTWYL